jgi:hypothetical protein
MRARRFWLILAVLLPVLLFCLALSPAAAQSPVTTTRWALAHLPALTPWPVPGIITAPPPAPTPPPPTVPAAPPALDALLEQGQALALDSDFTGAEAVYRRGLPRYEDEPALHVALSHLYATQPEHRRNALVEAQAAVNLDQQDVASWAALVHTYALEPKPQEALKAGQEGASLHPQNAAVQIALAEAYLLGDLRRSDLQIDRLLPYYS